MKAKEVLGWLFIFIIGSLVVSFLISPNSFNSFKNNVKSLIPEKTTGNMVDNVVVKQDVKVEQAIYQKCAVLENFADMYGISYSEYKEKHCLLQCSMSQLKYSRYECDSKGILQCYCFK